MSTSTKFLLTDETGQRIADCFEGSETTGTLERIAEALEGGSGLDAHIASTVNDTNGIHGVRVNQSTHKVQYYDETQEEWVDVAGSSGTGNGKCIPSVNSITLTDANQIQTFSVEYYGTCIVRSSDPAVAAVTISNSGVATVTAGTNTGDATITVFSTGDATHSTAVAFVSVTNEAGAIYGVQWDGSASQAWVRTGAAALFTDPVPAVNNGDGSSPFDTVAPWSGMEKSTRNGNVMVKIPKFWFKWTKSGSSLKLEISSKQKSGFFVSPAHANRGDGAGDRDVVYVGRYHCGASDYKSKTGVLPEVNHTRAEFRTSIHSLGNTIWQWDYATRVTIQMLYLVEYGNWDSQQTIGFGCAPDGSTSAVRNMGYTDNMLYHTGTTAVNKTTYGGTQYRYIEGLWDNCYDWCDGIYFDTEKIYIIKAPSSFSDTTGGTYVGDRATAGGFIKSMGLSEVSGFEWLIYPDDCTGADQDTYVGDYCGYNASGVVLYVGGHYGQNRNLGLFFLDGYNAATSKFANIGSRLLELPAA